MTKTNTIPATNGESPHGSLTVNGFSKERLKQELGRAWYPERPILISAVDAHADSVGGKPAVDYTADGSVTFRHPLLEASLGEKEVRIAKHAVRNTIFASFFALNSAISSASNSPRMDHTSLRERFDDEFNKFNLAANRSLLEGAPLLYGTYLFDPVDRSLAQILPEEWLKLGLLTSNSKLLTDVEGKMSWQQIQTTLRNKVVGFAGVSVGGSVVEAWLRNSRATATKLADPDHTTLQNLNRMERMNLFHLAQPNDAYVDWRNPYEIQLWNKARATAHAQHKADPYQTLYVYDEGISEENITAFLRGNGTEPAIDLLVEEVDDARWKYQLRKLARHYRIPVLMMTDFGHRVQCQFQDFQREPDLALGYAVTDSDLEGLYGIMIDSGNLEDRWRFVDAICGPEYRTAHGDEFAQWLRGEGEQPTASLPQLGSTAMVSGGLGGEMIAKYFLGYDIPLRQIWDLKKATIE